MPLLSLSKNSGVVKGRLPLKLIPALTACTSERMKTFRFSYLAGFAARELMREAKPVKTRKSGVQPLFRHSEAPQSEGPNLPKNAGVDKGPQPLMFDPALTTCASERMKTQRFSYFAGFAARELMREAKPVKTRKSG